MKFTEMDTGIVKLDNGEDIFYRESEGEGQKLVLIHGNMVSSKHFDILIEVLPDELHILAPDMRGFGKSSYRQEINSLQELASDVEEVMDARDFWPCALLGWSTGGGVAMEITLSRQEEVEKLILMESVSTRGYPMFKKDEDGEPIFSEQLETKEEIAADPVKTQPIKNAQKAENKEFIKQIWNQLIYVNNKPAPEKYDEYLDDILSQRNLVDIYYSLAHFNISPEHNGIEPGRNEAEEIDVPTLVLWGEEDLVITEEMARQTAADIGDNAELVHLEGCGHSPLIDDIKQLTDVTLDFLKN